MKIALISPSLTSTSESFIERHKDIMPYETIHYYEGSLPLSNEQEGRLIKSTFDKVYYRVRAKLDKQLDFNELALFDSLKKKKITLVYAEYGPTAVALLAVCQRLNLPMIVNFHGYDATTKKVISNYSDKYIELFDYAIGVIGVSKEMCRTLQELGCPKDKISHLACAPDPKFFEMKNDLSSKKILALGRFTNKKAPYLLLLSFMEVLKKHPDAELMILGDGELWDCCKVLVKSLGIPNVSLPGSVKHSIVEQFFGESAIFVQHSITALNGDKEGTPVSVMEASAAGIPVVSTRHAGIPDVIDDGKTGYLVDEGDFLKMADKISELLSCQELRLQLGRAGNSKMLATQSDNVYRENMEHIINQAFEKQRG